MSEDNEEKSEVLFENHQWSVTDYGVESVVPGAPYHYHFNKERLLEKGSRGGQMYDWPLQLAEKTWVDIEAFIEVFQKALDLHGFRAQVDKAMLEESLTRARSDSARIRRRG